MAVRDAPDRRAQAQLFCGLGSELMPADARLDRCRARRLLHGAMGVGIVPPGIVPSAAATAIGVGFVVSYAIRADGTVAAWENNLAGELGGSRGQRERSKRGGAAREWRGLPVGHVSARRPLARA